MDIKDIWTNLLEKYTIIKTVYIECEETDPELKTNLQPLNEFRAALDHVMKMMHAFYILNDEQLALSQAEKLDSHLNRCFYDICDMLSINYRNKIIDILEIFDAETISTVIPDYYSKYKPNIDSITQRIASYRNKKGTNNSDNRERFSEYKEDVFELKRIYLIVSQSQNNLVEVQHKRKKKENKSNRKNLILGGLIGAAASAIVSIVLHLLNL